MTNIGMFRYSTDPNILPEIDPEGIIRAFLLSVDNDPIWEPIIRSSTMRCYQDDIGTSAGVFDCGVIPQSFWTVALCAMKENYLKCPNFNANNTKGCDESYQYMQECFELDLS